MSYTCEERSDEQSMEELYAEHCAAMRSGVLINYDELVYAREDLAIAKVRPTYTRTLVLGLLN